MSDRAEKIMDAAEVRIRAKGYNGFSFREIAGDVGIKSASVHHHFPTKPDLAAAVARRYRERFEDSVTTEVEAGSGLVEAWRQVFRRSLTQDGRMCLCGVLAAEADGLPPVVAEEARAFFARGIDMIAGTSSLEEDKARDYAVLVIAVLEGAMLIARSLNNASLFERATAALANEGTCVIAAPRSRNAKT